MGILQETMFREAWSIAKEDLQNALDKINEWDDFVPVWSDVYNMTHTFFSGRGTYVPLGNYKSIGMYIIRHIPSKNKVMYIGEGKVWERKVRHTWTFTGLIESGSMEQLKLDRPGSKSGLSECAEKMFNKDKKLKNWSFQACIVDSKALSKRMEMVWKAKYNPPFNVEGYHVT